jgi:NAD(P)-dependent dehydrogenase (short-subunit alcohol dehydrogenase family)
VQTRDGRVWFITGASKGFGRQWATAALNRGDKLATARDIEALDDLEGDFGDLLPRVRLDVTDRATAFRTVGLAHEHSRSNVARRLALSLSDSVSDSLFHERIQMW